MLCPTVKTVDRKKNIKKSALKQKYLEKKIVSMQQFPSVEIKRNSFLTGI